MRAIKAVANFKLETPSALKLAKKNRSIGRVFGEKDFLCRFYSSTIKQINVYGFGYVFCLSFHLLLQVVTTRLRLKLERNLLYLSFRQKNRKAAKPKPLYRCNEFMFADQSPSSRLGPTDLRCKQAFPSHKAILT